MAKFLITGGAGFIGSNLAESVVAQLTNVNDFRAILVLPTA